MSPRLRRRLIPGPRPEEIVKALTETGPPRNDCQLRATEIPLVRVDTSGERGLNKLAPGARGGGHVAR